MIVPRSKLLLWVGMIVLPFSVLTAVEPAAAGLSLAAIGGLLGLALLDAAWVRRALAGISIELPEIARMSKDRDAKLEVRIKNERQNQQTIRLALPFPREIHTPQEEMQVVLPSASQWSRLTWSCRPHKRGNYKLRQTYLEGSSPLGFWGIRTVLPTPAEIRVYPNLLTERRNLAALFLQRGSFGLHAQRQVGKGRDFEKLREYVSGDSFEDIHWKATAKRGRPITKVFQIERTQEVYVIIDASRLSARVIESPESRDEGQTAADQVRPSTFEPQPSTTALERYVTAALVLGLAAERQGDLFGLLAFSNKVESFVRARNGQTHFNACRDALYTLQPQVVTPDFDEVCSFIRLRLRRRALLVFLTALDDPMLAESFVRHIDLIRRQHLVLVNMLQPAGAVPLFTNPNVASTDDLFRHLGGHLLWHNLRELEKTLQRRGVRFSLLNNEKLSVHLISQYLGVKQRQLL